MAPRIEIDLTADTDDEATAQPRRRNHTGRFGFVDTDHYANANNFANFSDDDFDFDFANIPVDRLRGDIIDVDTPTEYPEPFTMGDDGFDDANERRTRVTDGIPGENRHFTNFSDDDFDFGEDYPTREQDVVTDLDALAENPPMVLPTVDEGLEALTQEQCFQNLLDVLPDIEVDHALTLVKEWEVRNAAQCELLITDILDKGTYPKEAAANARKRKRAGSDDDNVETAGDVSQYEKERHINEAPDTPNYGELAKRLLQEEFLDVPVKHITNTLRIEKTLFAAFLKLEAQVREYNHITTPFNKIKRRIRSRYAVCEENLLKELSAAKKKVQQQTEKRRQVEVERLAEEENTLRAKKLGTMEECGCCFDEFARNRMVACRGGTPHFVCGECFRAYVREELANQRCRPICFATTDCGGTFSRSVIMAFLPKTSFERLEHLQQQEDIRLAGLDLAECPFCDYKAECPPIEVDREFRCMNPKCEQTSCRKCNKATHIPMSCEEARKDENLSVKHRVEEAVSEALIRHCNKCKNAFIKEYGCNKMTCSKCNNKQCYVCSKDVTHYEHFSNRPGAGGCPLHDNHEQRHQDEVKRAEKEAVAKIREERPDISEEELKIKVSDRVREAELPREADLPQHVYLAGAPAFQVQVRVMQEMRNALQVRQQRGRAPDRLMIPRQAQPGHLGLWDEGNLQHIHYLHQRMRMEQVQQAQEQQQRAEEQVLQQLALQRQAEQRRWEARRVLLEQNRIRTRQATRGQGLDQQPMDGRYQQPPHAHAYYQPVQPQLPRQPQARQQPGQGGHGWGY